MTYSPPDRDGPDKPAKSSKSGTERKRRLRERKKAGIAGVFPVEVSQASIKRMIEKLWFDKEQAQDREIVTTALENLVDCYGRGTLYPEPTAPIVTGTATG